MATAVFEPESQGDAAVSGVDGLLLVDKPGGMTSHDVVARVRRITGEKSIGHLGTLDPMATGLLPLVLGKYTRLAKYFGAMEKGYTGTIRFGFATDTYDAEGVATSAPIATEFGLAEVVAAAAEFAGEIEQMPPPYSAKKVGGKPAYALARAGQEPQLRAVRITIAGFRITEVVGDVAAFTMEISSGGYVRSVAHEMGARLGCGAHLASLRRTAAGPFTVEQAITLGALEDAIRAGSLAEHLPHPRTLLPALPAVTADARTLVRLRNGMQVNLPEYSQAEQVKVFASQGELAAIARRLAGTLFQPEVVLA